MHIRSFLFGLAAAAAISGAAAVAQALRPADDTLLAEVNGEKITYGRLLARVLDYHAAGALDSMINRIVVKQAADREKISVTESDIDRRVEEVKKLLGGTDPTRANRNYQEWLRSSDLNERQHRDQVRYTLMQEQLAMKATPVTDADLERLRVRVIACNTRQKATEMLNQLRQGRDFAALARIESDDTRARDTGGMLDPFIRLQAPTMWLHASQLSLRQFTREPVPTPDGFILIRLEERMPASTLRPDERQRFTSLIKVYRVNRWLENALKAAKITYPKPLKEILAPITAGA
jgi:foldase protein PrsA